ncbi:hypothetical protein ACFW4G_28040 [Paenibacillus lactis]|uniref:hypothetical protein n=1 Tax=Paenibacillus TaxID=44249 RepID=UPI0011AAFFA7|nr:hypothetical protein [Paenibacillus sp. IHBB 10380]
MEKRQVDNEMITLLRQLVMQDQIKMAGLVLRTYFVREWKVEQELANKYVRIYFTRYFPKQLDRYLKRQNRVS